MANLRNACERAIRTTLMTATVVTLSACATAPGRTASDDPWVSYNRSMYRINDAVDRATLKPAAKGYRAITPKWLRSGISNFFGNLGVPWVMLNELMQGKPVLMAEQTCRLVVNTVVGVGGFFDVASKWNLEARDEDFGQTLAVWGVPSGPYVVLPAFGPSTLRDGLARIPDYFARPQRYADINWKADLAVSAVDLLQTRESLLSLDDAINKAFDPYRFVRDAWMQRREFMIYDGNPPETKLDDEMLDDPADDTVSSTTDAAPETASATPSPASP